MSDWDGRGLPPAAAARMQRFQADGIATSLLGVPGAVATTALGLPPVGEVMGCVVLHLGWQGYGCGAYGMSGSWNVGTTTSGQSAGFSGYRPYVDALYRGYDTAVDRMVTEARAMGADGIVGVRLKVTHQGQGNREFVALGTAVRATGARHLSTPFVTDRAGADVAKLLQAGWVPVSIAVGISVAIRHDDYTTRAQARAWGQNVEVTGYTELVQQVRADARARFHDHAARTGAEVAIVSSMSLQIHSIEPSDGHRDHVAESIVIGGGLAKFHAGHTAPTRALSLLPLRRIAAAQMRQHSDD